MHRKLFSSAANIKTEKQYSSWNAVRVTATRNTSPLSFDTIKTQIGMKSITQKSRRERILSKTGSLGKRLKQHDK